MSTPKGMVCATCQEKTAYKDHFCMTCYYKKLFSEPWYTGLTDSQRIEVKAMVLAVCNTFDVSYHDIRSEKRIRALIEPRRWLSYCLFTDVELSRAEVCRLLNKQHDTVEYHKNNIGEMLESKIESYTRTRKAILASYARHLNAIRRQPIDLDWDQNPVFGLPSVGH